MTLIGMLLLGETRLSHLRVLENGPLFLCFSRLRRLPTDRTVSNTRKETTQAVQDRLNGLVRTLVYDTVREAKLNRLTLELGRAT